MPLGTLGLSAWLALAPAVIGASFTNPIGPGNDPWVIRWKDAYYLVATGVGKRGVHVAKAAKLQDLARAPKTVVWTPPDTGMWSKEQWAPELHYLDGKWYIYVAADDGSNDNHRIYVLEGQSQDPQGAFTFKGKLAVASDRWAIDASILTLKGKHYLIWSGWEGAVNGAQNIYIAAMANPWTLTGNRALVSRPDYAWEKRGGPPSVNEGPEALYHGDDVFLVYSGAASWTDYYCLGMLRLVGDDPMDSAAWSKYAKPVFSPTETVFGPGHCSFVKSPDGTEDWIVYHAAVTSGSGWTRNLRIQKFAWDKLGVPDFGIPVDEGVDLEEPSYRGAPVRSRARPAPGPLGASLRAFPSQPLLLAPEGEDALGRAASPAVFSPLP